MLPKLNPIDPEEIKRIEAEYDKKISRQTDPAIRSAYEIQKESAVAEAIGRQRQEAIEKGGPLAEKIKAENEAAMAQAREEMKKIKGLKIVCPECNNKVQYGNFCTECGYKFDGSEQTVFEPDQN